MVGCRRNGVRLMVGFWTVLLMTAAAVQADEATTVQEKSAAPAKVPPVAKPKSLYMRVLRDPQGKPLALQTSIIRCVFKDPARRDVYVDLIGAVHVGEKAYYQKLNKRFADYESVLYELVAPEGTRIPKGGPQGVGASPVSAVQLGMKSMLKLEFQLEHIDYTKKNLVHADMTPDEFSRSMKDRGESVMQIFFRMMGQSMAIQAGNTGKGTTDLKLLMALFSKDRNRRMKLLLAEEFESTGGSMYALEGKEGSTLITERNKKALTVLRKELAMGKKRVAIFYGAGHLSDFEKRLAKEFGLMRSREEWLDAWNLRDTK